MKRLHWVAAAVALACALPALRIDATMFFASWIVAWWWCIGLVLGLFANVWIHRLSGGRWGAALAPVALAAGPRLPWLLLLSLPLVAGVPRLYPWADASGAWLHGIAQPAFVQAWFEPRVFWPRLIAYGALWWLLCRPQTLQRKGTAAASLALYALTGTLASIDLLMSLQAGWFSTGFGLIVMSGQALGGAALGVLVLSTVGVPNASAPPLSRDFGNLLLMWLMLWAYLAFMEFLIIWAENLPREIVWFVPRLQTGWWGVALALVVAQFALPVLALLWRAVKDRPHRLRWVAASLLAGQLLNTAWLVLPSVSPHSALGWWLVPMLAVAMGLPLWMPMLAETRDAHA